MKNAKRLATAVVITIAVSGVPAAARHADCVEGYAFRYCGEHIPFRRLPLTFSVNGDKSPAGVNLRSAAGAAIVDWTLHWGMPGEAQAPFALGGSTKSGYGRDDQNTILFGDTTRCDGHDSLAVACVWKDPKDASRIVEVDIILDSNPGVPWAWPDIPVFAGDAVGAVAWQGMYPFAPPVACAPSFDRWYDVQSVVTHELGHAMGLKDVKGEAYFPADPLDAGRFTQTMYGYDYPCAANKRTLDGGDIAGELLAYRASNDDRG